MKVIRRFRRAGLVLVGLICLCVIIPTALAQDPLTLPEQPGDAANGALIFQARCANCHGPLGMGDGEMAANLPSLPLPIGTVGYLNTAIPADMYNIISNGSLAAGMPPFGSGNSTPLTVQERWDVIAAVFSLGTSDEALTLGAEIAAAADLEATLRDIDWINISNETALRGLPVTELDLGDAAQQALVDYGRSLSYTFAPPPAGAAAAAPAAAPLAAVRLTGNILNGSTGAPVADVSQVTVQAFDSQFQLRDTFSVDVDASGTFDVELNDVNPDWAYIAFIDYAGVSYSSDVVRFSSQQLENELLLTVFDQTTDASAIAIERLHVIVEFGPDVAAITEFYSVSNNGDGVFVGSGGQGSPTFEIALPTGAADVNFQRVLGQDFVPANDIIETDTGYADTLPLRPGTGTLALLVQYSLPYRDGMTVAHPLEYPVGQISLVMPEAGVTVEGEGWTSQGVQDIQGERIRSYQGTPGDTLSLQLNGTPRAVPSGAGAVDANRDRQSELFLGAGVLLIAVAVSGFYVTRWRNETPPKPADIVQQIASLDDAYEAGIIQQRAYVRRREQLKDQLRDLWGE